MRLLFRPANPYHEHPEVRARYEWSGLGLEERSRMETRLSERNAITHRLAQSYGAILRRLVRPITRDLEDSFETIVESRLLAHYRQMESVTALYSTLGIREPLPPMRAWAISPDFGRELVRLIRLRKPETILEFGSGVSTLLAAYALEKNGSGRIISIDHDAEWAGVTAQYLSAHSLQLRAEIVHAPLTDVLVASQSWQFYDPTALEVVGPVDMLVVDGPPGALAPLARYPALPLVESLLNPSAVIVMDDADRPGETAVIDRWQREFGPFDIYRPATEKGAAILTHS